MLNRRHCLAALLAPAAAGAQSQPQAPAERTLQIVGPWELEALEPARSGYMFARMQIVETLTDADDLGRPLPGLAARWTTSADGLTWRFVLRPTARFHDGTPVTAAAAAASLRQAQKQAAGVLMIGGLQSIAAEKGADGTDAVVIRLAKPFAPLPALLAHSSVQVLAPSAYAADGSVKAVIGSGPYRMARLQLPQQFEIEAFAGHDGPPPAIRRARYLSAGRAETRALMAEGGSADLAYGLDPASLQRLRQRGKPAVIATTLPRTILLKLNAGLPHFATPALRRALSLSIDRAGIARALLRAPDMAASQLFPPVLPLWHQASLPPLAHDPAAAMAAWAAAGWERRGPGGADAPLQRQGQPLRLKLLTYPDRPELPLVATALQAQWRALGIACSVQSGSSSDVPAAHRNGTLEIALVARNYAVAPDPIAILLQDFAAAGGDWGAMDYSQPALNAALDELARGATPERAAALRQRVAELLQADLPVVPIAWFRQNVAVSTRLAGVTLDPLERSYRLTAMRWA